MSGSKPSKPSKRDRARHGGQAVRPPRLPTPPNAQATGGAIAADGGGRRSLADWPVVDAFVNEGWDESGLATVFVARRHPRYGTIETGLFLVDLRCLGVKSAARRRARDVLAYEREVRPAILDGCPMELVSTTPELAAKIVLEGLAYAESLGFDPDPDFKDAGIVLDGLDPDADPTPVPLGGPDGKPQFIAGPYDDAVAIMKQLQRRFGPDGFLGVALLDDFDDDDGPGVGDFVPLDIRCPELAEAEPSFIEVGGGGDGSGPDDGTDGPVWTDGSDGTRGSVGVDESVGTDGSDADLEPGRYPLRELYCKDASCDCQRVTLYVLPYDVGEDEDLLHPDAWPEATISFSWADDAHLRRWRGDPKMSPQDLELLRGPLLDVDGLQGPGAEALLALFRTQLLPDPAFIARLARHYDVFRAAARSELERPGGGWFEVGEVRGG